MTRPAKNLQFLFMFHNSILSLQNASKKTNSMILQNELAHQNPYKMNTSKPSTMPFWVFSYKMLRWWGLL